jgi:hypothetical protein
MTCSPPSITSLTAERKRQLLTRRVGFAHPKARRAQDGRRCSRGVGARGKRNPFDAGVFKVRMRAEPKALDEATNGNE